MQQQVCQEQVKALAEEILRLVHAELARDPPARLVWEDMLRHAKGILKAVERQQTTT